MMPQTLAHSLSRRIGFQQRSLPLDAALILTGSLIIALLAQIRIYLPFTPVPITGQTFGVLLIAMALGARRGSAAILLYLLQGLAGLPVFAGGKTGIAHLAGPTGGYLIGFFAAAFLVGWLAEKHWDRTWSKVCATFVLGEIVIYLFGVIWLSAYLGWPQALQGGLLPFIPGDILKAALAAALLPAAWRLVGKDHSR